MNTAKFWSLQAVVIVIIDSKPAWCKRERRIRVADAFASQASLQALDSSAKLPVQSRAAEASNKLLHVIWMSLELPAGQSEDPGPVWI